MWKVFHAAPPVENAFLFHKFAFAKTRLLRGLGGLFHNKFPYYYRY